jgi:hypothetical protein
VSGKAGDNKTWKTEEEEEDKRKRIGKESVYDLFTHGVSIASVTVAARSEACTVFARSEAGIVGSNLT